MQMQIENFLDPWDNGGLFPGCRQESWERGSRPVWTLPCVRSYLKTPWVDGLEEIPFILKKIGFRGKIAIGDFPGVSIPHSTAMSNLF